VTRRALRRVMRFQKWRRGASGRPAAVVRPRVRRRRLQLSAAAVYDLNRVSSSTYKLNWRGLDVDAFDADLQQSELFQAPPLDLETAFRCYDQTLRHILDRHAPLVTKRVSLRQSVEWYDSECRAIKRTTRRLERQYRRQRSRQVVRIASTAAERRQN